MIDDDILPAPSVGKSGQKLNLKYAIVLCVGIFFQPSFLETESNPPNDLCLFFFIIVSILPV